MFEKACGERLLDRGDSRKGRRMGEVEVCESHCCEDLPLVAGARRKNTL